jgi:hypothetical protein
MGFGILTLATPRDYRKAIGLALSLRVSNPGVPVAVACSPKLRASLAPYFDQVIDEDPTLRGFVHKVHLDRYSPFEDTFFFDSDVLVFRDLRSITDAWGGQPYNACGVLREDGLSAFGLDRAAVCRKLGKKRLVTIDGAGHAFFRKPGCAPIFERAREVTLNYRDYAGDIRYADEDVMNIVLTMMDIQPRPVWDFFSRHLSAKPGTLRIDAVNGRCEMLERSSGKVLTPYMMHFAANEGPFTYARELRKLFLKFGADPSALYRIAIADFWELEVRWRVGRWARRLLGPAKPGARSGMKWG